MSMYICPDILINRSAGDASFIKIIEEFRMRWRQHTRMINCTFLQQEPHNNILLFKCDHLRVKRNPRRLRMSDNRANHVLHFMCVSHRMHFNLSIPAIRVNRCKILYRNAHFSRARVRAQQPPNNPEILRAYDITVFISLLLNIHTQLTQTHRIRFN